MKIPRIRAALIVLGLALGVAARAAAQGGEGGEMESGDVVRARFEYFYQQRRFPFARIPAHYTRAQMLRLRSASSLGPRFDVVPNTVSQWSPLGPQPISGSYSGRVTALAIDPRDSRVAYLGGAQGGVWKTTDGGANWKPLGDQQCSLAIGSIALDPVNPDIVYAGTGEQNFSGDSYYGCGVLRSTDGGTTWTQLGAAVFDRAAGGATVAKVIVDPATAGSATATTLLAATDIGLWRSTNSGGTWTQVLATGYGWVTDVVLDPNDPRTVYAASTSIYGNAANGVYKSTDGGQSFVPDSTFPGYRAAPIGRIALAIGATSASTSQLYAAVESAANGGLLGLYRTTDGGATWTPTGVVPSTVSCNGQCWYDLVLAVDPSNVNTLFLGTVGLAKSTDGGATFRDVTEFMHVDQHAVAIDPRNGGAVWAGNDGGAYLSVVGGGSWQSLNQTLALTQFYPGLSLASGASVRLLGGTQDNGTVEYTGVPAWGSVIGGDGGFTGTDPTAAGVAYGETQWIAGASYAGPRKRVAPGGFFGQVLGPAGSNINVADPGLFIAPLVLDLARPSTVYFGTNHVYRSRDGGGTWTPLLTTSTGLTSAIAPAPFDSQTVYVGTSGGGVFVTRNGGASWQLPGVGLPGRYVTDIVVHGANPDIAWITVSGFGTHHVFKTTNGGSQWQDINGNLPDIPVNSLVVLPGGELDVGTDLGVYRSSDGGATWTPFVGGLPNVAVTDLVFHRPSNTLVAATHGRGAFAATVSVVAPAVSLWVDAQPTTATSGAPIPPIAVSLREAAGSVVADAPSAVSVRIASGPGTLRGTTIVPTVNGVATFGDLAIDGSGTFVLAFSAPGISGVTATLAVGAPPGLSLSPIARRATVVAGGAPRADSIDVVLAGAGAATQKWSASHVASWSTLADTAGTGAGRIRWTRTVASLAAGTYVDTITVAAAGAQGSPARAVDSLVVLAAPPVTVASIVPDTLRGATGAAAGADLVIDVPSSTPLTLGGYAATVSWDSTVVRLDSVTAGDFAAPTVTRLSAAAVRLAATGSAPGSGPLAVARLRFHLIGAAGTSSTIGSALSTLLAAGSDAFDLLPSATTRPGIAIVGGVLRGDVDGDGQITAADARLILVAVTGGTLPSGASAYPAGDVDCDGRVTALDAQIVLAYVAGKAVPANACIGVVR